MKKKILPLFVLFWVLGHIQFMAQLPKGQFSPQDFVKHLESFIVREACLTPAKPRPFSRFSMNCMTNNEVSTGKSGNLKKEVCRLTRRTKIIIISSKRSTN